MTPISRDDARALSEEAYLYGYAIVENYRAVFGMSVWRDSPQYSGFNRYLHGRKLFDADYDLVVNPNNDTLYSTAFADLRAEPQVITVPPTGDRYFVIQLVDMQTDNFAYIGTRSTGRQGGEFLLLGPRFKGALPDRGFTRVIVAPSDFVALATRTAINGSDDLPGVIEVQDGLSIRALSVVLGVDAPAAAPDVAFPTFDPAMYGTPALFSCLNFLLGFHTPPAYELPLLERLSTIGVGPHRTFTLDDFPADVAEAIREGAAEGHKRIEERGNSLGRVIDGWQDIPAMGDFKDDYLFRSAVAWKFIYTNSPQEALYPIAETDGDGEPLSGEHCYVLEFPTGQLPPVDAFWSVTLYDSRSRLMVHNPIERYSIGDRTPGLRYGDDGSLTLHVQHRSPGEALESNWLPTPEGRFYLNARAYMPQSALLDGSYRFPAVRRVP